MRRRTISLACACGVQRPLKICTWRTRRSERPVGRVILSRRNSCETFRAHCYSLRTITTLSLSRTVRSVRRGLRGGGQKAVKAWERRARFFFYFFIFFFLPSTPGVSSAVVTHVKPTRFRTDPFDRFLSSPKLHRTSSGELLHRRKPVMLRNRYTRPRI